MAGLFAKGDVEIKAGHICRCLVRFLIGLSVVLHGFSIKISVLVWPLLDFCKKVVKPQNHLHSQSSLDKSYDFFP